MPIFGASVVIKPDFQVAIGNYNFGDDGGTQGAFTIFTVTGDVLLQVFGICNTQPAVAAGTPTIELGVSGDTTAYIAQIVNAVDLIANEVWLDATPTLTQEILDPAVIPRTWIVANGQDTILTIGGADLTAGDIDFYAIWRPLSANGLVVGA